jgi:uncharacterized integral membrane protein
MRYVTWTIRIAVFLFLLAFAVKNTDPVTLRFYFELAWQAPLIVLLLVFFAAGAAFGLAAALSTIFAQRRRILEYKRAEELRKSAVQPPAEAVAPPATGA